MSNLNRHPVRRAAVGVLAGTLAFTGGAIAAGISPANAVEGFAFERLAGSDRYGTAAAIALDAFPGGATTAIIARGDEFADALAANYLAGVLDAPILLTDTNNMPAATEAALTALGVDNVVIVGGTSAVSASVQAGLAANYNVSRLGGADRYLTAELIAGAASDASNGAVGELNGMRTAILASGQVFADALAAGPIAYAANHPILLTRPGDVPASTADVLADLDIEQVIIVGGTAAVSADVEGDAETMVGADAMRIGGQTRYETSAMIAEAAYDMFGFDETHVGLARGDVFADALAGGPRAGVDRAPILLTASDSLSPATEAFLQDHSDTLQDGHIFGGPAAVSEAVEAAAEEAAQGEGQVDPIALTAATVTQGGDLTGTITGDFSSVTVAGCGFTDQAIGADDDTATTGRQFTLSVATTQATGACTLTFTATPTGGGDAVTQTIEITVTAQESNQTFTLSPQTEETNEISAATDDPSTTTVDETNRGRHQFTVTGLTDTQLVDIAVLAAEDMQVSAGGAVTFNDVDGINGAGDNVADFTQTTAVIELVNGQPVADVNGVVQDVQPVNGAITFVIDSQSADQVRPVVFFDADNGGTDTAPDLDLDANNAPTEAFGVGGQKNFVAPAAPAGSTVSGAEIQSVNKDADQFATAQFTYTYDANDVFEINNLQVTQAVFESNLSSGDTITGTVATDPSLPSNFDLGDVNPGNPTSVSAEAGTGGTSNDITVTVTFQAGMDVDSVVIQRAAVTGTDATDETTTGTVGTSATVATVNVTAAQAAAGVVTFVDNDVPVGTYRYQAALVNDGDQSAFVADTLNEASTAPAADTIQPQSEDARVSTDAGFAGLADQGDVYTFAFNEQLATPDAGDTLRIQDADGTVIDVVNGTNATFSLNATAMTFLNGEARAAGEVLTVTLTSAPTTVAAGTSPNLQYASAVVTNSVGVTDVAGNRYDIAGSTDTTLNVAANVTTAPTTTDTTAPLATDAVFNGGVSGIFGNSDGTVVLPDGSTEPADAITVTYDEAVVAPAAGATITITDGTTTATYTCGTNIACTVSANGLAVTFTVTDSAAPDVAIDGTGDSVTGTTGVADAAGNPAAGYPEPLNA